MVIELAAPGTNVVCKVQLGHTENLLQLLELWVLEHFLPVGKSRTNQLWMGSG